MFLSVSKHIEDLARERTIPVLLVDEAPLLHHETLDHLHILLDYDWDIKALLSLILIRIAGAQKTSNDAAFFVAAE